MSNATSEDTAHMRRGYEAYLCLLRTDHDTLVLRLKSEGNGSIFANMQTDPDCDNFMKWIFGRFGEGAGVAEKKFQRAIQRTALPLPQGATAHLSEGRDDDNPHAHQPSNDYYARHSPVDSQYCARDGGETRPRSHRKRSMDDDEDDDDQHIPKKSRAPISSVPGYIHSTSPSASNPRFSMGSTHTGIDTTRKMSSKKKASKKKASKKSIHLFSLGGYGNGSNDATARQSRDGVTNQKNIPFRVGSNHNTPFILGGYGNGSNDATTRQSRDGIPASDETMENASGVMNYHYEENYSLASMSISHKSEKSHMKTEDDHCSTLKEVVDSSVLLNEEIYTKLKHENFSSLKIWGIPTEEDLRMQVEEDGPQDPITPLMEAIVEYTNIDTYPVGRAKIGADKYANTIGPQAHCMFSIFDREVMLAQGINRAKEYDHLKNVHDSNDAIIKAKADLRNAQAHGSSLRGIGESIKQEGNVIEKKSTMLERVKTTVTVHLEQAKIASLAANSANDLCAAKDEIHSEFNVSDKANLRFTQLLAGNNRDVPSQWHGSKTGLDPS